MTEPQSVALIREALAAGPVGHLHSTGEYCSDRQASPDLWPIDLYAIDRRDIAEVLQHVAALEAQVREMEADKARLDWIDKHKPIVFHPSWEGDKWELVTDPDSPKDSSSVGNTLREAIDAALSAAARGE